MKFLQCLPDQSLEILEFDKIRELLAGYCLGPPGKVLSSTLKPFADPSEVKKQLDLLSEYRLSRSEGHALPVSHYADISDTLEHLAVPGYLIETESIRDIYLILVQVETHRSQFEGLDDTYPVLAKQMKLLPDMGESIAAIGKILDKEGQVRPDASGELMRIHKNTIRCKHDLDVVFRKLLQRYIKHQWLAETRESTRNGRRVLTVLAEHKRKIRGIIHDESASGKTVYIEPEEVIGINNDLFDLSAAWRAEINRLIRALCDQLRPHIGAIRQCAEALAEWDLLQAKHALANMYEGERPALSDAQTLHLVGARHPLLYIKNKALERETVPFTLTLFPPNRILLLSGPNAGGKSVLMKAVGLIQVMVQSGLFVPVSATSRVSIYQKCCVELGDQQSLEDDLSTYSSKLQNLKVFLKESNDNTLILIDEFGSGSDPKLGGAIAESMLGELNKRGVFGVVTTHYGNLKIFAHRTKGILNGAMIFDQEKLLPTYRLQVGKPGSSYTFEIASSSGLDTHIIQHAKRRAGKKRYALESLIAELESEKKALSGKLKAISDKEKRLEQLIKSYERMQTDLNIQRKKFKLEKKEQDFQKLSDYNRELERLIRQIRENQDLEAAKKALERVKEKKTKEKQTIRALNESVYYRPSGKKKSRDFKVGDFVRLKKGNVNGKILSLDRREAELQVGHLRMRVPFREIVPGHEPIETKSGKSVKMDLVRQQATFNPKLDIRGMRADDAMILVQKFLDQAQMANVPVVRIIHGKGTGALRKIVREKLTEYTVSEISHPEPEFGGDGITIVTFS